MSVKQVVRAGARSRLVMFDEEKPVRFDYVGGMWRACSEDLPRFLARANWAGDYQEAMLRLHAELPPESQSWTQ